MDILSLTRSFALQILGVVVVRLSGRLDSIIVRVNIFVLWAAVWFRRPGADRAFVYVLSGRAWSESGIPDPTSGHLGCVWMEDLCRGMSVV